MKETERKYLLIGGLMVGAVVLMAIFAEQITTVGPYYFHAKRTIMEGWPPFPPSFAAPMGTDQFGRDMWSRIAFGARWSLLFAFLIMASRLLIATPMAILAAFGPRWAGWLVNRLYIFTSSVPPLLLYLLILSSSGLREVGLTTSIVATIALLTLLEWPRIAVLLRGRLEEVALEPFIEGAEATGATRNHIFWAHIMPHVWPTFMQVVTAEMGRGLLNIAQLGFFGIWVGGGLMDLLEYNRATGEPVYYFTTGVPEWGTLLADAREYIDTAPWIPLAPAMAFFVGVVGFNLLSQGMEGAIVSVSRLRERLTRRVVWSLRGAVAVALIAGVLVYNHGLPGGQQAEIMALAERQKAALFAGDFEGYLRTLSADEPGLRDGQRAWMEQVPLDDLQMVVVSPNQVQIYGGEAYGLWTVELGFKNRPPMALTRGAHLVRRGGEWYDAGEAMTILRGRFTEIHAYYDPTNPRPEAIQPRFLVNLVIAVADNAFQQAAEVAPWGAGDRRMPLRLYPSHDAFAIAIRGLGAEIDTAKETVWHSPDNVLHISPDFAQQVNRTYLQEALAFEMVKFLTNTSGGNEQLLPLLLGSMELSARSPEPWTLFIIPLPGQEFFKLDELFTAQPENLTQEQRPVYSAQSALLVQYLEQYMDQDRMYSVVSDEKTDVLAALAKAAGTTREQLSAEFDKYVYERVWDRSVLHLEGGKARVPVEVLQTIEARSRAAASPDATEFLSYSAPWAAEEHAAWHARMKAAGMISYEAALMEFDPHKQVTEVTVLERYTFSDGRTEIGISVQEWADRGDWLAGLPLNGWEPEGTVAP